jgi:HSP20 family molecular chaperone IbpA
MVAQLTSREVYKELTMFFSPSMVHRANRYGYAPTQHVNARGLESWFDQTASPLGKGVRVDSDEAGVSLSIDVPGLSKEQLTITIEADVVRIESKADAPRSFKAAYQLAFEVDAATSQASMENGVLTLKLGKVVPVSRETVLAIS